MYTTNRIKSPAVPAPPRWAFLHFRAVLLASLLALLLQSAIQPAYAQSCEPFPNPQQRFGFNVALDNGRHIDDYDVQPLNAHWYLDYTMRKTPSQPQGMMYAQMLRTNRWNSQNITSTLQTIDAIVAQNPGTLWLLGNEPDRDKQDGLTPAEYAKFYHEAYQAVKERDPSSRVAIAGVVQSTPLRRHYLDLVLAAYQETYGTQLPVDVWNMHAFILPENYIWGASIPPGMQEFADEGMQYTVKDHDSQEIFQANILAFRQWMADNGYRDTPLLVTEYGILLSDLHGFPYEKVRDFMLGSFDYFLTATDDSIGYPADGNRLVQAWAWFSLNYPPYDPDTGFGHNGNLLTPEGALLALGNDYGQYIAGLDNSATVDVQATQVQLSPSVVISSTTTPSGTIPPPNQTHSILVAGDTPPQINLSTQITNQGTVALCNLQVELWYQGPDGDLTLLDYTEFDALAAGGQNEVSFVWQPEALALGEHRFTVRIKADNANIGLPTIQSDRTVSMLVLDAPLENQLYLPLIQR